MQHVVTELTSIDCFKIYLSEHELEVFLWLNGQTIYNLMTAEKGTGEMQINKSLPKEIKTALRESKYKKILNIVFEKRKELKEKP